MLFTEAAVGVRLVLETKYYTLRTTEAKTTIQLVFFEIQPNWYDNSYIHNQLGPFNSIEAWQNRT